MATRKAKSQRKPGVLIDVARFISASQGRSTGRVSSCRSRAAVWLQAGVAIGRVPP